MRKFRKFLAVALITIAIALAVVAVSLGLYALFAGNAVNAGHTLAEARIWVLGSISFFANWTIGHMVAFLGIVAGIVATLAFAVDRQSAQHVMSSAFRTVVNTATSITKGVTEVAARAVEVATDAIGGAKIGGLPIWAWVAIGFGAVLLLKSKD